MVSSKQQQQIIFDQDLTYVPATNPYIDLNGYSEDMEGNRTNLPLSYSVEDPQLPKYSKPKSIYLRHIGSLMKIFTTGQRTS